MVTRVARLLLSGIFIHGGLHSWRDPGGRPAQAAKLGLPEPELMVRLNGAVMAGAGVALAVDVFPRLASLVLIGSMVPTTLAGHRFWDEEDERGRRTHETQFLKNVGLIGGLVLSLTAAARD